MKRITTLLLALSMLLALPGTALGHYEPGSSLARWEGQPYNGYSYWIWVCDIDVSDTNWEARFIDSMTEWDEIGGELAFLNSGWTSQQCQSYQNSPQGLVVIRLAPLSGNALAQTVINLILGQVDECVITIDSDFWLTTWGPYSFYAGTGSPPNGQVDLESVVVHELGHCVSLNGHSTHDGNYVMHTCLSPTCGSPTQVEKDELLTHDMDAYTTLYGTTH